ncbi:MAG TPA: fused MFS/spermidine synthase, partial [Pirellulales bacterium]|nr:fused MFS/spermidine synthase [Pirellulales bacterium]
APPPWPSGRWAKWLGGRLANLPRFHAIDLEVPLLVGLAAGLIYFRWLGGDPKLKAALAVALCAVWVGRPICFALCISAVIGAMTWFYEETSRVEYRLRSFYGVLKVTQDEDPPINYLSHGHIRHGAQFRDENPKVHDQPLIYYHRLGPIGQAFAALDDRLKGCKLAMVGLGVGSLAAYGQSGQQLTFFEIDPDVERIARDERYFTFLRDCPAEVRVVLGDARIKLAETDATYAMIVVDAFSGDAVPVHLLTREALELYRSKLAPGGVIAFHISNSYLRLAPVLGNLADAAGLVALAQNDAFFSPASDPDTLGKSPSHWVLIAADAADFGPLARDRRWRRLARDRRVALWTDDFSNLLEVFEWPRIPQ